MGDILRMAFTQNRGRSYSGASLSLTVCLLSYGPPPSISLTQLLRITLSRVTLKRSPIGDTKRSLRSGDQTDLRQVSKSVRFRQFSSPRVSLSVAVRDIPASHVLSVYCLLVQLVLFRTPLLFAHRTLYRPNARGGPSSRFSQFLELFVVTRNFGSTRLPDYPNVRVSGACLVCVILLTGYPDLGTYYPDAHVRSALFFSPVKRTWVLLF